MKINFDISETYNHFHFVENMSEWSTYTRKRENAEWIAATGPLNDVEKGALALAKRFFEKYDYSKPVGKFKNIFEFFAVAENMGNYRQELKDIIGDKDSKILIGAMDVLEKRFQKIWLTQMPLLEEKGRIILSNLHEKEIRTDIRNLFGNLDVPKSIDVFLVINTSKGSSGGANIGKDRITLECSSSIFPNHLMSTFWHEVTHLILADYVKEVLELTGEKTVSREFVNEVLTHSLFGVFGILTTKYFQTDDGEKTKKMVDDYIKTGIVSESGKKYIDELPFGLGHYYLSMYLHDKLEVGEVITPVEMAKAVTEVHKKA
jgi:hypothetical protein